MVSTQQIANYIETGLNERLNYEGLSFKVWATAGERVEPQRTGNTVQQYIVGNLKTATSALTPNILVMGTNSFTLVFDVPVAPPKTTTAQTAEDLTRIKDGQYWFLLYIKEIISNFFSTPKEVVWEDDEGTAFNSTVSAGVSIPEDIDLSSWRGNTVPIEVWMDVTLGSGVVMSLSAFVELDEMPVPFVAFTPERAGNADAAQYSSEDSTRTLLTSSAFAAEITIPVAPAFTATSAALDFLFDGKLNEAHFFKCAVGEVQGLFLVLVSRATVGLQGGTIASSTFQITEAVGNIDMLDFPQGFQVGFFELPSSQVTELTFQTSQDCLAYAAGAAYELTADVPVTIPVLPKDVVYDDTTGTYRLYMVTSKSVSVAGDYAFEVE